MYNCNILHFVLRKIADFVEIAVDLNALGNESLDSVCYLIKVRIVDKGARHR